MSTTCAGIWGNWTDCNAVCDNANRTRISATGTQTRTYTIPGQTPITTEVTCTKLCPVNCTGEYSEWSDCNATCSNNQKTVKGIRKRTFSVRTSSFNGGDTCNDKQTAEECNKMCPVNCVGKWSDWSGCESNNTCQGKDPFIIGKKKREYLVTTPASNGGNSCEIEEGMIETEDCRTECKVDNMFFWMAISFGSFIGLLLLFGIYYYITRKSNVVPNVTGTTRGKKSATIAHSAS